MKAQVVAILLMLPPQHVAPVQGVWSMSGPWASQVVLVLKNLPANAEDVRDLGLILGQEDPLEEGMETHPSTLAWRIFMDRGVWQATTVHGVTVRHD